MLRLCKVSLKFVNSNFKRFISSICSLATFLLIVNILAGVILSTTGIFSKTLTNNNTMHFMEVIFDNEPVSDLEALKNKLNGIEHIDGIIIDSSHPVLLETSDSSDNALLNLVGVPKGALKYFGVDTNEAQYFFIPSSKKDLFEVGSKAFFEEGEYQLKDDGTVGSILKDINVYINDYYVDFDFDMLPSDLAIIDDERMMEITKKMYPDGVPKISRVLLTVDNIEYMKEVENKISKNFPSSTIRYSLKYSDNLPSYSVMLIAGSSILLLVLVIICLVNIQNNVNQILDTRNRDIGLLTLFGTGKKNIKIIFTIEFVLYGIVTFLVSSISSLVILKLFMQFLSIDLLTYYWWVYISFNFIVSVVVFSLISIIQTTKRCNKLDEAKLFKEFLK